MADVSKLFFSSFKEESFLNNLEPDERILRTAKVKVRQALRAAFESAGETKLGVNVRPRFFTQGSSAYRTLNEPAWPPKQQKDLDDGCYLPLSFMRGARPSKAASLFFDFVDATLIALAKREGWKHVIKPTCSRLIINSNAHIDVPLYAIPDREFRLLEDKAIAKRGNIIVAKADPDIWEALPADAVLLAHREEDWIESDPRKIHIWYLDAVRLYGERLRRDSRYMKAWRDHHKLDDISLTSILLMGCVWTAYEQIGGPYLSDREDRRLLQVVERLPGYLSGVMKIPACKEENLNRMSAVEREKAIGAINLLRDGLRKTINDCSDKREAVDLTTASFGPRTPNRPDLVVITATAVTAVLSQPRRVVAAPEVGRSKSG